MDKRGIGRYVTKDGHQGFIKEFPIEIPKLEEYDLTPTKYTNALSTKQQVKSLVLTEKQESFFDRAGGDSIERKLFESNTTTSTSKSCLVPGNMANQRRHSNKV
jgi:hypothetical protein